MTDDVNSKNYWENRFRTDWHEQHGPEQSEMFARVAIRLLPAWLNADIATNRFSILDAGCAEGEAVDLLARHFGDACTVEGVDFSAAAIECARAKFGERFHVGDVSRLDDPHDVVFTSNTLEHFADPLAMLDVLARNARQHLVVLVPFWEWSREREHAVTFEHSMLPATLASRFVCTHFDVQNTARLPQTHWFGFQSLIVYSSIEAVERLRLNLDQVASGLQPRSLLAEDIVAARAFGATMGNVAALADGHADLREAQRGQIEVLGASIHELVERSHQQFDSKTEAATAQWSGSLGAMHDALDAQARRLAEMEARANDGEGLAAIESAITERTQGVAQQIAAAIKRQGDVLSEKIHILEARLAAQDNLQQARAEIGALKKKLAAAESEVARLSTAERHLANDLELHRRKAAELAASSSWRITAPLRGVASAWYRLRGPRRPLHSPTAEAFAEADVEAIAIPPPHAAAPSGTNDTVPVQSPIVDPQRAALDEILARHAGMPIIVLRPVVDWDLPLFQRPHHIAARLAKSGFLYFYCTPNGRDGVSGFRRLDQNLYLTDQFLLVNRIADGKILHLYSTDNHCTPEYVQQRQAAGDHVMYEYIDEIHPSISGFDIPPHVIEKHSMLLGDTDVLCIASADKLLLEARAIREHGVVMATNGVEHEHFAGRNRDNPPDDIADLVALGKPIIGYFGAFAVWFDYELVERLARARPDYTILLLGWDYDGSIARSGLAECPNVRVLGPIPYRELPEYARFFDVSTIPFLINDITESTSPIKLFEYMSLEHPIVTTNLPECRKYASVMVAADHGEFIALVDRALDMAGDAATIELLRGDALANTWDSKAAAIAHAIGTQWPHYAARGAPEPAAEDAA